MPTTDPTDDLSPLAWVQDELRSSLEAAHKSLRRFVRTPRPSRGSDIDVGRSRRLRMARAQLHQGVGALEMVGLRRAALCCARWRRRCSASSPSRSR